MKELNLDRVNLGRTVGAALIPPVSLVVGAWLMTLTDNVWNKVVFMIVISVINLSVALALYGRVLKTAWPKFRVHIWRNLLLAIAGAALTYVVIGLVRSGLGLAGLNFGMAQTGNVLAFSTMEQATLGLGAAISPLLAPFTEEIIFRHALFFQFNRNKVGLCAMFVVSSVAFGLVHWNNFHGDIVAMVPYMAAGAWFALIYFWSKNIWQNIATHFFFDFVQVISAVVLFFVALFNN
ncbi:CPBP family intramembrane glutamic endopeptidase [Secundilactobacillus kimchicus]|uniref:CPBP family intramembrane glutamic endopeptidase n=1 Tax=Secundilactobacillus kimchicus TaxID=528209 RepID=UPI0024A8E112|nr:CPBP family intramembrane glutamic endopeptidase [Secundilactobacillus kimchicus]